MEKPVLVVLAAGMGSRYGGLKQMDSMGGHGQAIIDYSIYDARRAGFEAVIFVIKHELEADFKARVGDRISRGIRVQYAFQELDDLPAGYAVPPGRTKPWGTTHATLAARDLIRGPFAVINSDDYYGPSAFQVMYDFLAARAGGPDGDQYAMVGYQVGNTVTEHGSVARGVCEVGPDGCLRQVVERTCVEKDGTGARFSVDGGASWTHLSGDTPVSMNFWGFPRSFLDEAADYFPAVLEKILAENPEKGEYLLPLAVTRLLETGKARVRVLHSADKWFGVTYQADKPTVVRALRERTEQGLYPEGLWGN